MRTASSGGFFASTTVALATVGAIAFYYYQKEKETSRKKDEKSTSTSSTENEETDAFKEVPMEIRLDGDGEPEDSGFQRILTPNMITIVHGSVTGTCSKMAKQLHDTLLDNHYIGESNLQLGTTEDWDWWDELLNAEDGDGASSKAKKGEKPLLVLLLPTYTDGTWPPVAFNLQSALQELLHDWRISKFPLKGKLNVAVFGMGSSAYAEGDSNPTMGKPAKEAVRSWQKLGAKNIVRVAVGDDAVGNDAVETFATWQADLLNQLPKLNQPKKQKPKQQKKLEKEYEEPSPCGCGKEEGEEKKEGGCCQSKDDDHQCGSGEADDDGEADGEDPDSLAGEHDYDTDDYPSDTGEDDEDDYGDKKVVDLEDMGDAIAASGNKGKEKENTAPKEMVTPSQAVALKKEGYKLIGTHSAVKLCRWTKHQLRGRGGCYKHTFYGITSYQCMEATPSLACANKCVFCWRHHKNPVAKEWKWKTDDPHYIVEAAVNMHISMIKETKGIPGVRMDRWKEAHTVKHCALSLVGEPIMYPRIDELLGDLHSRKISTFLVTNGQHPPAIDNIRPITQLYVSVDAPTEISLIAVDRPLFNDAWDRLKESLVMLKAKGQRTVARLTVVKGWNTDEVAGYAALIALGKVSLVEVKGVTYCGKSDASNLNMSNSPWHHEIIELTQSVKEELDKLRAKGGPDPPPEYAIACEHRHSCSVLLARVDQLSVTDPETGKRIWRTWIDYDKFHELAMKNAADPTFTFGVEEYTAETPAWALFGAEEEGFDPTDTRHRKAKKHPKYTQFDDRGVPTHDHDQQEIGPDERVVLESMMRDKMNKIGTESVVTELKDGGKQIEDASLMFRGMTIAK
jgi:tRNA wybutosine-synthesizing protein 1